MVENTVVSFNVNAELYQNSFGELAVMTPGEKVYRNVGLLEGTRFQKDVIDLLERGRLPAGWTEMPARELPGRQWTCIARLGYLNGEPERPAVEFEGDRATFSAAARAYLADVVAA